MKVNVCVGILRQGLILRVSNLGENIPVRKVVAFWSIF